MIDSAIAGCWRVIYFDAMSRQRRTLFSDSNFADARENVVAHRIPETNRSATWRRGHVDLRKCSFGTCCLVQAGAICVGSDFLARRRLCLPTPRHRRGYREVGQGDPCGQHQVGVIRWPESSITPVTRKLSSQCRSWVNRDRAVPRPCRPMSVVPKANKCGRIWIQHPGNLCFRIARNSKSMQDYAGTGISIGMPAYCL